MEDRKKLHTEKEILKIASKDSERFLGICNYYLENDTKLFKSVVLPILDKMINNYIIKNNYI